MYFEFALFLLKNIFLYKILKYNNTKQQAWFFFLSKILFIRRVR